MNSTASIALHAGGAAVSLVCVVLLLIAGRGSRTLLSAAVCTASALWAVAVAFAPTSPLDGLPGTLEVIRAGTEFALLLVLCAQIAGPAGRPLVRGFAIAGGGVGLLALLTVLPLTAGPLAMSTVGSPPWLARFGIDLLILLLAENIWRNADEASVWHINLPCIAIGGVAIFDLVVYADAALSGVFEVALLDARAALVALAGPLLVLGAARDRRWRRASSISRTVVFHGATLMVAGTFLLVVGSVGAALRRFLADWGGTAAVSLLAGALMVLSVALATRSARSRLRRLVVDHFFAERYDYRREWLRCVTALSAADSEAPPPVRAVRAVADAVDSPAGVLLLRDFAAETTTPLSWAGSWNRPSTPLSIDHALLALPAGEGRVLTPDDLGEALRTDLRAAYGEFWLLVPLPHPREGLLGCVLLAPPRAPFPLDDEVFDLLRTLGREVAMFLAERRAAERLVDGRKLADYAKRFAFVAHDVKNVSSQLTLVLANAEHNLHDPEFQQDMLVTVRAAAARIDTLIARLRPDGAPRRRQGASSNAARDDFVVLARLHALVRAQAHPVRIEEEDPSTTTRIAMPPERFDELVAHLLDNAAEASASSEPVRVRLGRQGERTIVDIIDHGPGMTPEFIRDELFRPLRTTKANGNGIGAWQARELLREAGGDLDVRSRPGEGTTMRLILPGSPLPATPSAAMPPAATPARATPAPAAPVVVARALKERLLA